MTIKIDYLITDKIFQIYYYFYGLDLIFIDTSLFFKEAVL